MDDVKKSAVYQKALELSRIIGKTTRTFPKDELYGLTSQLRHSADALVLNITKCTGNSTAKEFLETALRAGFECIACLHVARNNEYMSNEEHEILLSDVQEITALLNGLKQSISN